MARPISSENIFRALAHGTQDARLFLHAAVIAAKAGAFDKAHTVMLVEEKLLDPAAGAQVLRALRKMETEGVIETRARVGGGLHSGEHYVIRLLGEEIGGQFHLARSSGDLSSVAINVLQRERLLGLGLLELAKGALHDDSFASCRCLRAGEAYVVTAEASSSRKTDSTDVLRWPSELTSSLKSCGCVAALSAWSIATRPACT